MIMEKTGEKKLSAKSESKILKNQVPTDKEVSEVEELLHELPENMLVKALMNKGESGSLTIENKISQQYSGPIPPPSMLNEYDMVKDGFAERIVTMAESEQKHRHQIESLAVKGAITKDKRSQIFALICVLFLSSLCGGLIYSGHDTAGAFLGGTTLVGLTALFITNRNGASKKQEESEEQEELE